MRSNALKLSQPTVFACITFLLLVMNLEQAWYVKADIVALYHRKTGSFLTMNANGSVTTGSSAEFTANQCMERKTVNHKPENKSIPLYLSLYNPETKRFLCFTKDGKLIGRKKCFRQCQFTQTVTPGTNGYEQYKAAYGKKHHYYISFNRSHTPKRSTHDTIYTHFLSIKHEMCNSLKDKKYLNETTYGQLTTTKHPRRHARHRKH